MMGLDVHDMEDLGQIYVGYDEETRVITSYSIHYTKLYDIPMLLTPTIFSVFRPPPRQFRGG